MRFDDDLTACADLVRRGDPERFLAAMAAPVASGRQRPMAPPVPPIRSCGCAVAVGGTTLRPEVTDSLQTMACSGISAARA